MTYEEKMQEAQRQVERLIDAGVPIVKMDIFDALDQFHPSEALQGELDYTKELYLELVDKLKSFPEEVQTTFLQTLKEADIIDNQSIEKEDSFMVALSRKFDNELSIDLLLEKMKNKEPITKEEFIHIHDVLLRGTSAEDKLGLRDNDLKFVGSYQLNPQTKYSFENRAISYFPLRHTEIDAATDKFLGYINSGVRPNDEYDMFLLPMVCHGLLAALQLFKDGNTRYGRLFQSLLLYQLTNQGMYLNIPLPLVYASRQYAAFRDEYRQKIEDIVLNNNAEAWEAWFKFCLRRLQDGIYYNMSCLDRMSRYQKPTTYH